MIDQSKLTLVLSKFFKPDADRFMKEHPEYFSEVLKMSLTNDPPMCWRAAWLIHSAMTKNDERVRDYVPHILNVLPEKEDGHQRELMKIMSMLRLSDDQEGKLYDISVTIWESLGKAPSVRYLAFQHMEKMMLRYPELIHEIEAVTQPQYINTLSKGVKAGVLKRLRVMGLR